MPKPADPSALHHPLPNPSPVEGEGLTGHPFPRRGLVLPRSNPEGEAPVFPPSPPEGEGPGERGIQDIDGLEAEFASAVIAREALITALCETAASARALADQLIQSGRADRALMIEQEYRHAHAH